MSWQTDLLGKIGAPATQQNVDFLSEWSQYEGVNGNANNWLASTQSSPGCTPTYNSAGVQECATLTDGVDMLAATMQNGYYGSIVAGLKTGDAYNAVSPTMLSQINTWGTHGFSNALAKKIGYTPGGSENAPPTVGGIVGGIESFGQGLLDDVEGIGAGIIGGAENFLQALFGGQVSSFLRLPQSLINIGWNFAGFTIGVILIFGGMYLLGMSVFEDGLDGLADAIGNVVGRVLGDQNPAPAGAAANAATTDTAADAAEVAL